MLIISFNQEDTPWATQCITIWVGFGLTNPRNSILIFYWHKINVFVCSVSGIAQPSADQYLLSDIAHIFEQLFQLTIIENEINRPDA